MNHVSAGSPTGAAMKRRFALVLGLIGALCAVFAYGAASAKADPVQFRFSDSTINLGGDEGFWVKLIDSELDPPDPKALITVDYDAATGDFTGTPEDFFFPQKKIENLHVGHELMPYVDFKADIMAESDFSGNFDPATGGTEMTVPAYVLIDVYQAGSPFSAAKCSVSGFDLELATTGVMSDPGAPAEEGPPPTPERPAHEYNAAPYAGFPGTGSAGVPGALIATWPSLPKSEIVSGSLGFAICPEVDKLLGGSGGVFMDGVASDQAEEPPTAPELAPKITSAPSATTTETSATFEFAMGDGEEQQVSGFECKLDAGEFEPCNEGSKTYAGQTVGSHTFTVRATNPIGAGPESTHTWTIESTGPGECPDGQVGTPPNCENPPLPKGKLGALKIKPKVKAVKRGKKATFTAKINNAGDGVAKGVKVCVTAPKKLVKVKKCVQVGNLAAGKARTVKFKVTVTKKAKKGKKIALKFKATSNGAGNKSGKATVKVK